MIFYKVLVLLLVTKALSRNEFYFYGAELFLALFCFIIKL